LSRDYRHEDWIPWYTEDSPGWLELSLAARGAAEGIARKMGRDRDELHLGSRGLRGLAILLHCRWEDLEPALAELLSPGPHGEPPRLVYDPERQVIHDPEAADRRRPTSTGRVRAHRASKSNPPPPPVSETHETDETVSPVSSGSETGASVPSPSRSNSGSSDLGSDLPDRSPTPPRFASGPTGQDALEAYEQAVADATGKYFRLTRAPYHRQDLCVALNAHAPPGSLADALAWLRATVAAWVRATEPKYAGGWTPSKFNDWLNADRPDRRERKSAAEVTRQPFDPEAPWMKLGDTGS
jgi:hypothetical protein